MLVVSIVMLAILVLSGLVMTFVAFPHRDQEVPAAVWLGPMMNRVVAALPTLDNTAESARRR